MTRCLTLLILLAGVLPAAAADWVSPRGLPPGPPRLESVPLATGLTRVLVDVPGFFTTNVEHDGRNFARVGVPGAWPTLVAGEPELPRLTLQLRLPPAGTPVLRVVAEHWREVMSAPVVPSRGNILRNVDPAGVPLVAGPAYDGGVHPAAGQTLGRPYLLRGERGVGLTIHPLRWDADRGRLLVLERLELEMVTTGDDGVNVRRYAVHPDPVFDVLAARRFPGLAPVAKYAEVATGGRMLVVTATGFTADLAEFVQWKRERGMTVEVATSVELGGTASSIAEAVASRYAEPAGLTYLLLVGDIEQVPTHVGLYEGADNDTRYAMVEGDDLYPDLFVSRISARDRDELLVQLNKFVRYERDPEPDGDWYDHAVGVASILGDPTDAERADWLRDDLLGYDFTAVDRLYEPSATAAVITAALDEGRSLMNYLGHGSGFSWSNPAFGLEQVAALANDHRQPWIIDVSCANGRFSSPECFAEAWLRAGTPAVPRGALAMYSASTTTPWIPPTLMQAEVVDLLVSGRALEIGALCQHGIMKVLDAYPDETGRQLVEQYNILGDCSLQVRTRRPRPLTVTHAGSLAVGVPVFTVQVDTAGATVALTAPGRLLGAAVTDEQGQATLVLTDPPVEPGELVLTVTGPNLLPHREILPVVRPLTVVATPTTLPVGQTTGLAVTTSGAVGVTGEIELSVEGWGVAVPVRRFLPGASVILDVTPDYGEDLALWVRDATTGQPLHHTLLPVTGGVNLVDPGVTAAVPAIAMDGTLAPGTVGVVRAWAGEPGAVLGLRGNGVDTVVTTLGDTLEAEVVPLRPGYLTAVLLKTGRIVHEVRVPVVVARGTLVGLVVPEGGGPGVAGARVRITRVGDDTPLQDMVTDPEGRWALDVIQPVGAYEVVVERYGYIVRREVRALLHGDNEWEVELSVAPPGTATGQVVAAGTGAPLAATVAIHRLDNGMNVATVRAGADGRFVSVALPAGWFRAVIEHPGHRPRTIDLEVAVDGNGHVHELEAVTGRVLVIGDNLPATGPFVFPARLGKHGSVVLQSYTAVPSRSASEIWGALMIMGYVTDVRPATLADPDRWPEYDLVVVACGDNPAPLVDSGLRTALMDHVTRGGRLLLEGGDLAAVYGRDPIFARQVLHIAAWQEDGHRETILVPGDHALAARPVELLTSPVLSSPGYAGSDEVTCAVDAVAAVAWAEGGTAAVGYDPDPDATGGQIVFLPLDLERLLPPSRNHLLQNAVEWLLRSVPKTAGLVGEVVTAGGSPAVGARITLEPGGVTLVAGPGGVFGRSGLVPGSYRLVVRGGGAGAVALAAVLPAGGALRLDPVMLPAFATAAACTEVDKAIPDNDPTAVAATAVLEAAGPVTAVRLCLKVDHTWPDDLTVDLTNPGGRTVRLRYHRDTARPDASGCFDSDAPGDEILQEFLGEEAGGTWLLRVGDAAVLDTGSLVDWCLEVDHAVAAPPAVPPPPFAWLGNHPNPFNPGTTLRFTVPRTGVVEIGIFDVRGRRVRTLHHLVEAAGPQTVVWDGRDGRGRDLGSGVYLVRVNTAVGAIGGKMLLLR